VRNPGRHGGSSHTDAFATFHRDVLSGEFEYSNSLFAILAAPEGIQLTPEVLLARVLPEHRALAEAGIFRSGREPLDLDVQIRRFDGALRTVRIRCAMLFDSGGRPARLVGTIQDVTEELEADSAHELLSNLVESSDDAILTKDRDGKIVSWNAGAEVLYGYSGAEAIGRPVSILEPPELSGTQDEITHQVFAGEPVDRIETEWIRKDGKRVAVSLTVSPVRDASGNVALASIIARDITERKRYERRLRYLADHDQLTGLINRRRFEEDLKRELARAGRHHSLGAVLSIDIDKLKSINDSAGHSAGDTVLIAVANVLKARFRAADVVARVGGDEFSVLLVEVTPEQARAAAFDLRAAVGSSCRPMYGGRRLGVTVSIGVAAFESDDATSAEVLVNADLAMYAAKAAGGDGVVLYSRREAERARALTRQPWSERIRDALGRDRFVLHFQPILDLRTDTLTHGEFLLRMRGDNGNLIPPGAFLPVAERQGLIHEVDRWVVRHAIELMADSGGRLGPVGVNVSGDSIARDPQLLRIIKDELSRTDVEPSRLIFEVTETAAIANMPEASNFAAGLRSLGCSLALDDFGTGFGSFYYLKHLPVGYVKLDGEFIKNLPRSPVDGHVVRAIVGVARALGIKTVAESVTDAETIDLLREHGVDYAQGFYVGRPAPLPMWPSSPKCATA
jgi:diguanylate cyclase (GGDEF)-like protein/PAS domain S-box-containing protein